MELSFSDYAAGIAILISLGSVYYAKSQRDISAAAQRHDLMAHLSTGHERYRSLLGEIRASHRTTLNDLRKAASVAHRKVIGAIDQFDSVRQQTAPDGYTRPLRHIVGEAAQMLHFALNGQLAWQSGANIASRFYRMASLEECLSPRSGGGKSSDFRARLREEYLAAPNAYQENALLSDPHFCALIRAAQGRIDRDQGTAMLQFLMDEMQPVWHRLAVAVKETTPSLERLEDALQANELEQFPLTASATLFKALKARQTLFDTLAHLVVFDASADLLHHYRNHVSIAIYCCALLEILANVEHWGWDA